MQTCDSISGLKKHRQKGQEVPFKCFRDSLSARGLAKRTLRSSAGSCRTTRRVPANQSRRNLTKPHPEYSLAAVSQLSILITKFFRQLVDKKEK